MWRSICLLMSIGALSLGCNKAQGAGGGSSQNEWVKAAENYATAACACETSVCTAKESENYKAAQKAITSKDRPSGDETKKIADAMNRALECGATLNRAGK